MHHGLQPQQNYQPPQRQAKPPLEWRDGTGGQKMTDITVIFPLRYFNYDISSMDPQAP
jgi:hypothetical protein